MRIGRVELIRYGHFTDRVLAFPRHDCDLHVIVGPNEAGKSTLLEAIGDFLFGIPRTRTMDFVHENRSLLLGASLETDGEACTARRRKGVKDTLLDEDGIALAAGEAALRPYLGHVDRALFERMFSLNHSRLREGGRALLNARDEVGQMLFAASAGIASIRSLVESLRSEADALWGPRRAAHRRFTAVEERLLAARRSLQESTITAKDWADRRERVEIARSRFQEIAEQIAAQEMLQGRLARIRRVSSKIRRIAELTAERDAIGRVISLPEDAREVVAAAQRTLSQARAALGALESSIADREREREALVIDAPLLERADEITRLEHERGAIEKAAADEVNLRRELTALEAEIVSLAPEFGWEAADAHALALRAPQKAALAQARALVDERAGWTEARAAAERALAEARERKHTAEAKRATLGPDEEVSVLAGLTDAARGEETIDLQIEQLESRSLEELRRIERRLVGLQPPVASASAWAAMCAPQPEDVRTLGDARRAAEDTLAKLRETLETTRRDLEVLRGDTVRLEQEEGAVAPEVVGEAREKRDAAWNLIERHCVRGEPLESDASAMRAGSAVALAESYRGLVSRADELADRRFEKASVAARMIEMRRSLHHQEAELAALREREQAGADRCAALEAQWQALWADAGVVPGAAPAMLRWLEQRGEVLAAWASVDEVGRAVETLRAKRTVLRQDLLRALKDSGVRTEPLEGERLAPVLRAAEAELAARRERNAARSRAAQELSEAQARCREKTGALETLHRQDHAWLASWSALSHSLGLRAEVHVESLRAQLGALDELREKAARATALRRDRIETIERDRQAWQVRVGAVVAAVAPDLEPLAANAAIWQLRSQLTAAQEIARRHRSLTEEIARQRETMRQHCKSEAQALEELERLEQMAGADSIEALVHAIAQSDRLRELTAALIELRVELSRDGDGLPEEQLAAECRGADPDEVRRREAGLIEELKTLRERLADARDALNAAQRDLDAVGGDDRAAAAQAILQSAAAELRLVAEEYLRASIAGRLLDWVIERYRREKQGPLLSRAGELFGSLTGGSFARLVVRYDEQDVPQLVGERPDGRTVELEGMSDGTRDQLFLALRIAALEHYFESAPSMPFVADDLFINFDEGRARAGLALLGELARRVQVLFFTHHRHVVELAREACGEGIGVVEL